jgi:hypothetical protein
LNFFLLSFYRLPASDFPLHVFYGAGDGIRTRDPNLGKVVLYQLSYTRNNRLIPEAANNNLSCAPYSSVKKIITIGFAVSIPIPVSNEENCQKHAVFFKIAE